ncbi:MAG: flagellar hook-basal body protein [Lachnospiraceae bacterium]|nr:flagellar hook-basal body protein [Lachnospiraceae bacterium]
MLKARTATTDATARDTLKSDLLQKAQTMVNDLRSQYQDFYVYGGNDVSTPPFSLSADGTKLTFSHKFPGETDVTNFEMELKKNGDNYEFELLSGTGSDGKQLGDINKLVQAMSEHGYMDLGYGDIRSRDTLLDTFTGGMNVLTGMNSDTIQSLYPLDNNGVITGANAANAEKDIMKRLTDGPLGTVLQGVAALDQYADDGDPDVLDDQLEKLIGDMTEAEHVISTVYSDLGNKYKTLENTEDRLNALTDSLKVQYKDIVGADPYESILEMYNNQYAYNAALQVGSNLMQSSLFDFVR